MTVGDVASREQLERGRDVGVADVGDRREDVDLAQDHRRQLDLARRAVQADEQHAAAPARAGDRRGRRVRRAARLDHDVEADAVGELEQQLGEVAARGVRRLARAEGRRRREPVVVDVDRRRRALRPLGCDAPATMNEPIPPAPITATASSGPCATRESAWRATASGCVIAAASSSHASGTARQIDAGDVTYSASPPSTCRPSVRYSAHRFVRPRRHQAQ